MRRLIVASLLVAAPVAADTLTPTLGQPVREVSHTVDVTVDKGVAVYRVRRVFANAGERADEAGLELDLPYGAAATGLRIRARTRWFDGELMEADKAAALYHEMTGLGAHQVKDPALLQWMWADKLYLQVFPVLPASVSTVEYTLTVPTRYQNGKVFLSYPHVVTEHSPADAGGDAHAAQVALLAKPVITIHASWADATTPIAIDGARISPDTPVVLTPPQVPEWLAQLGIDATASTVSSTIAVADVAAARGPFNEVTLSLDVEHTFKSDIRIDLVTPAGARVPVFGGDGGGDNDVKGTFPLKLDQPEKGVGLWRLAIADHVARDSGTLNAWSIALGAARSHQGDGQARADRARATAAHTASATDTPVFIPDAPESDSDAGTASIVIAPPPIDVLTARLGKVVASKERSFSRLEIDTAPELMPLPKQARVVFVVDGSHSAGPEHIDAQLALVRGYLAHVDDAFADIVVARRHAARAFGALVAAKDLPAAMDKARAANAFAPGNGSALDEGVRAAVKALEGAPNVPLRIVLFTDELLRSRFQNAWVLDDLRAAPPRTIVHVVVPVLNERDQSELVRDDKAPLAPFASEHHGVFARIDGLPAPDKRVADVALGLVRPVQIDGFAIAGLDVGGDDDAIGGVLHEGVGLRATVQLKHAPDRVTLTGRIWGDAFRRPVGVGAAFSKATAAFVFGEDDHHELSDAEMLRVAFMGRAVSPVTSYLAAEPGVRPSPLGIDRSGVGYGSGMGSLGGTGHGAGGGGFVPIKDLRALADAGARECLARHPAKGTVTIEAETTRDEIVDVVAPKGKEAEPLLACLVEAVWLVRLPAAFGEERERFALTFP